MLEDPSSRQLALAAREFASRAKQKVAEFGADAAGVKVDAARGREVLAASVGDKDYGILTIAANLRSEVEYLFSVDADCFYPSPKVVSSVVRLRFRPHPTGVEDEALFFRVVRTAFQQRRKMLRNSLAGVLHERVEEVLASAGVDPAARPESVSVEGFERVCRAYAL